MTAERPEEQSPEITHEQKLDSGGMSKDPLSDRFSTPSGVPDERSNEDTLRELPEPTPRDRFLWALWGDQAQRRLEFWRERRKQAFRTRPVSTHSETWRRHYRQFVEYSWIP